ncbi:hypothetical protein B9Z45_00400 [Limnohabitans sp. 2KL-17]|uniref:hypothetical protein n=1 Tax=Limnohabitans sp. 2KL-17 TaxID=1100704 RepID=UPI000D3577B3|nr:hypothetical protein [Limnohabitans sp. 2KL-17]PUE63174.1 hypothetical protein B9Z45_00400 [Limnohabitans sp. 2KL-17]
MGFFTDVFLIGKQTTDSAKTSLPYYNFGKTVLNLEEQVKLDSMDLFKSMVEANAILKLRIEFDNFVNSKRNEYREGAIYFLSALVAYKIAKDGNDWDWKLIRDEVQSILIEIKKNPISFRNETLEFIDFHTAYIREAYESNN